jgi:SAM-dependent methyltransferase
MNESIFQKEKHVYQRPETVGLYEESHYIEEGVKEQIVNQILDLLSANNQGLKILDAGIGGGRLILLPLLDQAIKRGVSLDIIGIDNSEPMINDLKENLKDKYKSNLTISENNVDSKQSNALCLKATTENSSITVFNYDLEDYKSILELLKTQFDVVISVLTLHHLKSWRLALYSLARSLKKDGYLILFEWTKGIKLRDGNFVDSVGKKDTFEGIDKEIVKFWESFYKERYKYHSWLPEIMASDYSKINDALKKPFFEPVNKDGKEFDYSWCEKANVSWGTLRDWINKRAYSNFHRGLSENEHNRLLNWVNDYYLEKKIDPKTLTKEKLGCRLRIFKKQCELNNFERTIIFDSIMESSLYEKLIYEKKEKNNNQRPLTNLATLLIQHDTITNNTPFFTINLWDILINHWHKEDKPLVFNKGFFDDKDKFYHHVASVLLYYAIIEKFEENEKLISATKFIFRELSEKPVVTIHKTSDQKISRFFIKNIRTKTVEILLPESLLLDKNGYLTSLIDTAKKEVESLPDEVWKPLKEDMWNLIYDDKRVTNLLNKLKDSINTEKLFSSINSSVFKGFHNDLKECFYIDPELIGQSMEGQIVKFCNVLAFHLLITNWDSMIYVPSEVLLPGEDHPFGFGGVILAEENKNDKVLKYYLSKRAEMLRIAINMKFRAIGAGQWANKMVKDIREKEQILINTYHDITRHIITHDVKSLDEKNVKYLRRKLEFMRKMATGQEPEPSEIDNLSIADIITFFKDRVACTVNVRGSGTCLTLQSGIETIIENMISNTIRHNNKKEADINIENNKSIIITYEDKDGGWESQTDDNGVKVSIKEKFENWRKGFFSTTDEKKLRGTGIRGIQLSIDFIGASWEVNWKNGEDGKLHSIYRIILPKPYPTKWNHIISEKKPVDEELKA